MDLSTLDIAKLEIIHYPDPRLRERAEEVVHFDGALASLAQKMIEMMVENQGIGLAATQLGLPVRLIVISLTGQADDAEVLVNPVLSNMEGWSEMEEGCLSVPGIRGKVKRAEGCVVSGQDLDGKEFRSEVHELAATVVQHETDHLNGKLFVDRLGTVGRMAARRGLQRLEREFQS